MNADSLVLRLAERGQTVATAESLTGGLLAATITSVPGASAVYVGGVVSYAASVKQDLLDVPAEVVTAHGTVSAECARAMAAGARHRTGADWAMATTGVAGPDPLEGHPVGSNQTIRESVLAHGLEITPVEEVAQAAWDAVHGDAVHTVVGKTARRLKFAARWMPGRLRKRMLARMD